MDEKTVLTELKYSLKQVAGDRTVRLILYGSRARGDYDKESDIDLAIIVQGLTREIKNRMLDKVTDLELKHLMPLSAIIFSEDEFNRLKERERRIALDIEGEGITL
jgi:predicted nucleotidyltransferase